MSGPAVTLGNASPRAASPPDLRRAVRPMRAVLEWRAVDKSILGALIFLAFTGLYWLVGYFVLEHPDVAPYLNRSFLPSAFAVQTGILGAWVIFIAICLVVRRRRPDAYAPVYVLLVLSAVEILWGAYLIGLHTSPFFAVAMLATVATGYVWYERGPMTVTTVVTLGAAVALAAAEALHLVPEAPLFSHVPLRDGVLPMSYVVTFSGVTFVMLIALVPWVAFIVSEFHERGERLADANDIISRYVASQLAEQIKSGNHGELDHPARRKLTLFFSDIQGFAATADGVEPEDLSAVLNEYLSEMTAIGVSHGATIDKFLGDAIMIFFGAPSATNDRDHALRAVRMAMEMQTRMVALRAKWSAEGFERPFHIRIGINTGHASIGAFGSQARMDYTAIGRQVNLAARLQTHCEPDRILVSHSTWLLVKDVIACAPRGEIVMKGLQQPVRVYEVGNP